VVVRAVGADAVQVEVHPAQAGDVGHQLRAAQGLEAQVALLVAVQLGVALDVFVRSEKEAARAAGGVGDDLARLGPDAVHDRVDDRARREVLPRAALHVLGVALQQPLVGIALHVGGHRRPVFLADQLDDELAQLGRVLDLVLRLLKDQPEHPALQAQLAQRLAVVLLQLDALHLRRGEVGPAVALGDRLLLAGEPRALVGHLEEEQEGELLQVVLI